MIQKIGFGGGCHWCTEAIFQSLIGVTEVEQGWIASTLPHASSLSEAVIVHFDETSICQETLIEIHLLTHNATSNHTFREKYRSAIYTFSDTQQKEAQTILKQKASLFKKPLVTKVYPFGSFKRNKECYLNYYRNNPQKPFCQARIEPKLQLLLEKFSNSIKN
jgi:peptide-methionine (S)-S-oxide reductase